jgi:4-amino-4-deoxy-L-arabinose transferase-like glycosyltransferase
MYYAASAVHSSTPTVKTPFFLMILLSSIVAIVITTGIIAVVAPPNTWDSMTYHMSRVVHWIQNRSVEHYPTGIIRQLESSPWAEFTIMHVQILSGGDYVANLVQWFSMMGSIIGVTLIAESFGVGVRGQVFAAVIAATVPMGILQSSSTQNDYVVTFWLVCFVYFGILGKDKKDFINTLATGASLGLAILTKGTAYLFAFPFFLWFIISGARSIRWQVVPHIILIVLIVLTLNGNHYRRNYGLFGNPLTSGEYSNEVFSFPAFISNVSRNLALHIGTRSGQINDLFTSTISSLHYAIRMDINDPKTTWQGSQFAITRSNTHEDTAGNPLHMILIVLSLLFIWRYDDMRLIPHVLPYLYALFSAFLIFCFYLKWQPWASRLHLPLFVLWSALCGTVIGMSEHKRTMNVVMIALLMTSIPYVVTNESRPLISDKHHKSILMSSRLDQYFYNFYNQPWIKESYSTSIESACSKKCGTIGLRIGGDDWEYPIWVIAKGMNGCMPRIEHIHVNNVSANIPLMNFKPCAVLENNRDGKLAIRFDSN